MAQTLWRQDEKDQKLLSKQNQAIENAWQRARGRKALSMLTEDKERFFSIARRILRNESDGAKRLPKIAADSGVSSIKIRTVRTLLLEELR